VFREANWSRPEFKSICSSVRSESLLSGTKSLSGIFLRRVCWARRGVPVGPLAAFEERMSRRRHGRRGARLDLIGCGDEEMQSKRVRHGSGGV
jgi:hypothetical protein